MLPAVFLDSCLGSIDISHVIVMWYNIQWVQGALSPG
jgi:hypothetical protein